MVPALGLWLKERGKGLLLLFLLDALGLLLNQIYGTILCFYLAFELLFFLGLLLIGKTLTLFFFLSFFFLSCKASRFLLP